MLPAGAGFKAVIFDLDGLLVDTERFTLTAWKAAFRESGREMDDAVFLKMLGRDGAACALLLREIYGPDFPASALLERCTAILKSHTDAVAVPFKPGAPELVKYLEVTGMPRAVATSSDRRWTLARLGDMAGQMQAVVTRDDVSSGKPAPDLFIEAARRLNVQAAGCLVLEDSKNGIIAARAAGMTAVFVPDLVEADAEIRQLAHHVIPSLDKVKMLLGN